MRNAEFDCDVAVLGGGSGGFAAARAAAEAGLETVLIEGGREVGGLCILRGCMPSKALLYAAEVLHLIRRAGIWGLEVPVADIDFAAVMARKARLIGEFARDRRDELETGKFGFVRARACFSDAHTVELTPVGPGGPGVRKTLRAGSFIVATGSVVSPPPLPQLAAAGFITSDDALSLKRLPDSIIVLGGGAVACELAQFFARCEVKVTMIQRGTHLLRGFDKELGDLIGAVFLREGIRLFTGTELTDASRSADGKSVSFVHQGQVVRVEAEEILLCLGRTPNTADLGLERIGVKLDRRRIVCNARMQSSVPHIYAAGDCTGPYDVVHLAVEQGEIAANHIARPENARTSDTRLLTRVIFTDPQIAAVGLSRQEAEAGGIPFFEARYAFKDHGKSLIMEALDGFVQLLAHPQTGEILGGACAGPLGGELIHEIIAAMAGRMTVHQLAAMPHYHPTLAEIWTYPAEDLALRIRKPVQDAPMDSHSASAS